MPATRRAGRLIAVLGAATMAALTLSPAPDEIEAAAATPLLCLVCGERGGADVVSNLLLTIPLGLGVRLATGSWVRAVAIAAALSLTVELLQLGVIAGRDPSLSDLLTNSAGGGLGAWIGARTRLFTRPDPREGWMLLLAGGGAALVLVLLSAWLQTPAPGNAAGPGPPPLSRTQPFRGTLSRVAIDGVELRPVPVTPDTGTLGEALRAGSYTIEARVLTGPVSGRRATIHAVGEAGPRLVLGQLGRDAFLALPARSVVYRLRPPGLLLRDAFPRDSGVAVTLRADVRDRTVRLHSSFRQREREVALALSPSHGWVLVAPFYLGRRPDARLVTAGLLLAVAIVLGWWAAASGRGAASVTVLAAVLVLGLAVIPALGGYQPVHWSEWLAAAGGAAAGWALWRGAAYLQPRCGSPSASVSSSS